MMRSTLQGDCEKSNRQNRKQAVKWIKTVRFDLSYAFYGGTLLIREILPLCICLDGRFPRDSSCCINKVPIREVTKDLAGAEAGATGYRSKTDGEAVYGVLA